MAKERKIINTLNLIPYVDFKNPRGIRINKKYYLEIELVDKSVTEEVLKAVIAVSYIHNTHVTFSSLNKSIIVRFEIGN